MRHYGIAVRRLCLLFIVATAAYSLPSPWPTDSARVPRSFNKAPLTISLGANGSPPPVGSQGWTSSPNGRGTIDIIWSSFLTVFLCGWTTICVNVPPQGATRWGNGWRKFTVFCEALAGPEFIFHTALGQYVSAHKSVKEFADAGHSDWTARHGFFADMGGFVLKDTDEQVKFPAFPLTAPQVHYLVVKGYVGYDKVKLSEAEIEDKNKFDALTRGITMFQLAWFVINVSARAASGMAITTLELSTICFIFCTLGTYFCWRHKPQDISCPIELKPNKTLVDILKEAGPIANRPYSYTPMDFVKRPPHIFEIIWRYCFSLSSLFGYSFHPLNRPIDKIWDDSFPDLPPWAGIVLAGVQFGFAGLHFLAWNWYFPSAGERLMWRICCVYIVSSMIVTWFTLYWNFEIWPWIEKWFEDRENLKLSQTVSARASHVSTKAWQLVRTVSNKSLNRSSDRNPQESVPFFVAISLVPLGAVYCLARMYIILEDVINLRNLPSSAYDSVDWSGFLPHF